MILERDINYKYLGKLDVSNISNKIYNNNLDWEDIILDRKDIKITQKLEQFL